MKRILTGAPVAVAILSASSWASAQESTPEGSHAAVPTPERVRSAAAEYDAGRRAFIERKYGEAATHFENAFHDVPRAEALRNAIRARREGKMYARAATLAALAESTYPDDATTMVVVRDTLAEAGPRLHRLTVVCTPACGIVSDGRAATQDDAVKTTLYLDPGAHSLVFSFGEGRVREQKVAAKAGGRQELDLLAPPLAPPPPEPASGQVRVTPLPPPVPPAKAPSGSRPFGPAVFWVGVGITAVGTAATIISGIDAVNNPGKDRIRNECGNLGEACPLYQQGENAQTRTNILIGMTAGVAVITAAVGIFLTDWSSPAHTAKAGSKIALSGPGALRFDF